MMIVIWDNRKNKYVENIDALIDSGFTHIEKVELEARVKREGI